MLPVMAYKNFNAKVLGDIFNWALRSLSELLELFRFISLRASMPPVGLSLFRSYLFSYWKYSELQLFYSDIGYCTLS